MHSKNQSQTITPNRVRDAAIQIISTNAINTAAVVLRGMKPTRNGLIEIVSPIVFSALVLAFFF
jgi:hypothetical protein